MYAIYIYIQNDDMYHQYTPFMLAYIYIYQHPGSVMGMAGLGEAPREAGGSEDDGDHHRGKRGLRPGGAPQRRQLGGSFHGENPMGKWWISPKKN